ncbi:MAG: DKNYY domain-containing protein [Planctomycetaceae bacterium]
MPADGIYCGIQRMVVEHPDRFEALPNSNLSAYGRARDGEFYYRGPERVEGADYASFQPIHDFAAADKNRRYEFERHVGNDPPWWPRN